MKKNALLFLFLPFLCAAQKKDTVLKYLDEHLQFTSQAKAVYYAVAVKTDADWFVYALYPDTTPLMKAHFRDKSLKTKQGPYISFYPKNKTAYTGFYENNRKQGVWQSWYESGQQKDSGFYTDDIMTGTWKRWHENGTLAVENSYSSTLSTEEKQMIRLTGQVPVSGKRQGKFISWYPTGAKESEGYYRNHLMEGTWEWFRENGKRSTIENYKDGLLTDVTCFDTTGNESGNLCSINRPATLKDIGDYKSYLMENLVWPEAAIKNRIEGTITVSFTVSKEGKLKNLDIKGSPDVLNHAVSEFFRSLPDWEPAVSHNRIVEWKDVLQVPFYFSD